MNEQATTGCPVHDGIDRRKSAKMATANTEPDAGAHWVKKPATARKILRHKQAIQAGAGAEYVKVDNPEHTSVFFLDGEAHRKKRMKTQRFLSPQEVTGRHYRVMEDVTRELLADFQTRGTAKLEDISFKLAIEVVGEILGLTNSEEEARASRIRKVLTSTMSKNKAGLAGVMQNVKRGLYTYWFFLRDVKPAMRARRSNPKDDALSFYIEEGYSDKAIIIECLTYGTAGMLTTREFIIMAAWYLFEDDALRERFMAGDMKVRMAILMEILRLEPVAAMIHRRVDEPIEDDEGRQHAAGEVYGIDIRRANVDEDMVGECPFTVDPERAKRMRDPGRFMSFGDGPHGCPGWQVALHETRIFLEHLFRIPGIRLLREPDMSWNDQLKSYELRNADIACDVGEATPG